MTNLQKVKRILLADNAWDAVLAETELFGPTIAEMEGVPHVNYHAEGGVLDHVKLAFEEMQKIPDHDWFDLLLILFHDVGKRKALAENGGKNMAKHDIYSGEWFNDWCERFHVFDNGIVTSGLLQLDGRWVIENHMVAHHLHESSSPYRIMTVVTDKLFPRLARLATADALATLGEDGKPHWPFSDVLNSDRVLRWLGKPRPLPVVDRDDFIDVGVPHGCLYEVVEFGLKLQINNHCTDRDRIINDVMCCDKIKNLIREAKNQTAIDEVIRYQG